MIFDAADLSKLNFSHLRVGEGGGGLKVSIIVILWCYLFEIFNIDFKV